MKNKFSLLVLVIFVSLNAQALPKITTSITPVASIVAVLTENNAEISVINVAPGCPHHYQMRPSDKEKVANSSMLIYIDDSFDGYAAHLASSFKGKVIKISDFKSINFLDDNGKANWHFWLDLDNVLNLQEELALLIKKEIPSLTKIIDENISKARARLQSLKSLKQYEFVSLGEVVVLSDSLDHFVRNANIPIIKLYQKPNASLQYFAKLESVLHTDSPQCIILDSVQDSEKYKKFNKKIIQLEAENWAMPVDIATGGYDLFYTKYLHMINQLKNCR